MGQILVRNRIRPAAGSETAVGMQLSDTGVCDYGQPRQRPVSSLRRKHRLYRREQMARNVWSDILLRQYRRYALRDARQYRLQKYAVKTECEEIRRRRRYAKLRCLYSAVAIRMAEKGPRIRRQIHADSDLHARSAAPARCQRRNLPRT